MKFALAWNGRRRLVAVRLFCRSCAQAGMFFRVLLHPPTAARPPHLTENDARCVYLNAAVKQPSVRSFPFKTERSIPAAATAVSPLLDNGKTSNFEYNRVVTLVQYITHRQYTTYIKQDEIITKLSDIWLHVSAVTGHLQAN